MSDSVDVVRAQEEDARKKNRRRKALLAGGLVLGLGAAATLAAWSDEVFSDGTFFTGTFELEGAADAEGINFQKWDSSAFDTPADSAPLLFNQSTAATLLSYDEPVFAPLQIRLSEDTSVDGTYALTTVRIDPATTSPLQGNLDYVVYSGVPVAQCAAGNVTDGTAWTSGTIDDAAPASAPRPLVRGAGSVDNLCLAVTLTSNSEDVMGVPETTIEWQFTGEQSV